MLTYLLRRLLLMLPTLLGITVITFSIIRLAPGDPVELQIGGPAASEGGAGSEKGRAEAVKRAKIELGLLDRDGKEINVFVQYGKWVGRLATLDFGTSFKEHRPVIDMIGESLPVTLLLNLIALCIAYSVAVPIGVFSAVRRNSVPDHLVSTLLFLLWSVPSFLAGTLFILTIGRAGVLPFVGLHSDGHENLGYFEYLADSLRHVVLPIACLTYASFAGISRFVRQSMLENLGLDYVRTARAKGLEEGTVVFRHALRNSLIPVVTIVGTLLPALIGGSVIVESIFTINGMGNLGFNAVLSRDYPVIMAIATFSAVLTMIGILVSDVLYCLVDPRISLH